MSEIIIKIDLQNYSDMECPLKITLESPYHTGNLTGNSRNSQELIDNIKEPEKEIQTHQKEEEKNQKLLSDKDAEIEKLRQSEKETKSQLEALKKEYDKKLTDKDEEISRLKKKLESCSIHGSDDPSEEIYFKVLENGTLKQSRDLSNSLYKASKRGSIYKFTINTENGPTTKAISDVDRCLSPYCNIEDQMEGANTINTISVGEGKMLSDGSLQVEKKAVISLSKL